MSIATVLLVVLAALIHATWNLLAKRAADVGAAFVFAYTLLGCMVYAPWVTWILWRDGMPWSMPVLLCIGLSGVLHLGYNLSLQRGYQVADLSVVYVDAYGVKVLLVAPVVLDWCAHMVRLGLMLPWTVTQHQHTVQAMRGYWGLALLVGTLSPLSYILVLAALSEGAPLSVVAPVREMSMMMGAVLAVVILHEPMDRGRLAGCLLLTVGVVLLVLS